MLLNEIPHNNEFKGSLQLVEGKPTIATLFYAAESPKIQTGIINYWYSGGDLHNNLLNNFKEISWKQKITSLYLVFLGSVRSGSSSLNLELEPELEPAHLAVFRTRTEPEPMILELEPNPNL